MNHFVLQTDVRVAVKRWGAAFVMLTPVIFCVLFVMSSGFGLDKDLAGWVKLFFLALPIVAAIACCLTVLLALLLGDKRWVVDEKGVRVEIRGDTPVLIPWHDIARVTHDRCSITVCLRDRDHHSINFVREPLVKAFRKLYEDNKGEFFIPKRRQAWPVSKTFKT